MVNGVFTPRTWTEGVRPMIAEPVSSSRELGGKLVSFLPLFDNSVPRPGHGRDLLSWAVFGGQWMLFSFKGP